MIRDHYILEHGRPRVATREEWGEWSRTRAREEPVCERTVLERPDCIYVSIRTCFLTQGFLPTRGGKLLPWATTVINGPMSANRWYDATLAEARTRHWELVDQHLAHGYEVKPLVIGDAKQWGPTGPECR